MNKSNLEYHSESAFSTLQTAALENDESLLRDWYAQHRKKLEQIIAIFTALFGSIQKQARKRKNIDLMVIWQEMQNALESVETWVGGLPNIAEEISEERILGSWRERAQAVLDTTPKMQRLPLSGDFWSQTENDPLSVRWQKRILKLLARVRSLIHFRKKDGDGLQTTREVPMRRFLTSRFVLPVCSQLLDYFETNLLELAAHVRTMHQILLKIEAELLFQSNFTSMCNSPDKALLATAAKNVQEQLTAAGELLEEVETQEKTASENLHNQIATLSAKLNAAFQIAGTFQLPARTLELSKLQESEQRLQQRLASSKQTWLGYFQAVRGDWSTNLVLRQLEITTALQCRATLNLLQDRFQKEILPVLTETGEGIASSLERFKSDNFTSKMALREAIVGESEQLIRYLREKRLPVMIETIENAQIENALETFTKCVEKETEALPDQQIIFKSRNLEITPPEFRIEQVHLKQLVIKEYFAPLLAQAQQGRKEVRKQIMLLLRELSDIDQIVEFNLESSRLLLASKTVKEKAVDEAGLAVIEGLERAINKLDSLLSKCTDIANVCNEFVVKTTDSFLSDVENLIDNDRIMEIKLRLARAEARARMQAYRSRLWRKTRFLLTRSIKSISAILTFLQQKYLQFRRLTGMAPAERQISEEGTSFLLDIRKKMDSLPYVYQRLFTLDALEDERFFIGREAELETIEEFYAIWQKGQFACLALVGEKGSGKTSLLNYAKEKIFSGLDVQTAILQSTVRTEKELVEFLAASLELPETGSLEELEENIAAQEATYVVILENLQRMFMRVPTGFDTMERFLLFISRTNSKIFWLTTATLYSWQFFDRVIHISDYFRRVLYLDEMPQEAIEDVVLKRHRVSGYQLVFETPDNMKKNRKFKALRTEQDRQDFLQNYYFTRLHDIALGNISITLLFWQNAIRSFSDEEMYLSSEIDFDYTFLNNLPPEKLFTLCALLQHEFLTPAQHAEVFQQSLEKSVLQLRAMADDGLLVEDNGSYLAHRFLYRHIVRVLKVKNYLY